MRRANGAASRFASPKCASASVSAVGMRIVDGGEDHRARDEAAAAEDDVGPPRAAGSAGTRAARRPRAATARSCASDGLARQARRSGRCRARSRLQEPDALRRDPATRRTSRARRARLSASATASAGSTCPAVPPAAIRHRNCCFASTMSDVKEDPDSERAAPRGSSRRRRGTAAESRSAARRPSRRRC